MVLDLGLLLPLDLGLPGGGGNDEGAGETLFSFSSWWIGERLTLRSSGAEAGAEGDVEVEPIEDGVDGLFAALSTEGASVTVFWVVEMPLVIGCNDPFGNRKQAVSGAGRAGAARKLAPRNRE